MPFCPAWLATPGRFLDIRPWMPRLVHDLHPAPRPRRGLDGIASRNAAGVTCAVQSASDDAPAMNGDERRPPSRALGRPCPLTWLRQPGAPRIERHHAARARLPRGRRQCVACWGSHASIGTRSRPKPAGSRGCLRQAPAECVADPYSLEAASFCGTAIVPPDVPETARWLALWSHTQPTRQDR
jgi:hypothetical protein